jgi:hypothetical protein
MAKFEEKKAGEIPERPNGTDCKSVAKASQVRILLSPQLFEKIIKAGVAQLVERQPSKLQVAGSSLVSRSLLLYL